MAYTKFLTQSNQLPLDKLLLLTRFLACQTWSGERGMPIYEFRCEECGKEFEKFVISYSQISSVRCPECGSEKVVKKVSACSVGGGESSGGASCSAFG